jgi:PBP1b-binding outer membrane lipoprotein LpoB
MKLFYLLFMAAVMASCNNSTETAAPTEVDNTKNNDTPFVQHDSSQNMQATPVDSTKQDSTQQKQ